ncbi:MAG: phytoene/squalene synthase family protein, partial [Candidatus Thorarchaeota archaeon]
ERYIKNQIDQYFDWVKEAESGFRFIPRRYYVPIKTASDMYKWTALQIRDNPFIIYDVKVKPSKRRIILNVLKNFFKIKK